MKNDSSKSNMVFAYEGMGYLIGYRILGSEPAVFRVPEMDYQIKP